VYALLTIRGKTGAVIALQPIKTENTDHVAAAFTECMTVAQRRQVIHVATDDPSVTLIRGLKGECPNLKILSLDPMHIVFVYEQTHWRKRTAGSKQLRLIMAKVVSRDTKTPLFDGTVFDGSLYKLIDS
jgi:hypothetical protein